MKSAVIPQVRVEPELRTDLESVLREGESLSEFVEATVRSAVAFRRTQAEFHARGEAAWQAYQRGGVAHSSDQVLDELREKLQARRAALRGETDPAR